MMAGRVPGIPWPPGYSHRTRGKVGSEVWILDAAAGKWTKVADNFPGAFWVSAVYDPKRDRVLLTLRWTTSYPLRRTGRWRWP